MIKRKISGVIFTVALHSLLLLSFLTFGAKYPESSSDSTAEILELIEVQLIPITEPQPEVDAKMEKEGKSAVYPTDGRICNGKDKFYKGVGIIFNPGTNTIIHAPEYYPGYIAGLRVGDYIENTDLIEVDGYIDFDISRYSERLSFHIKADNICFQEG